MRSVSVLPSAREDTDFYFRRVHGKTEKIGEECGVTARSMLLFAVA
jgi:hypothetical protein